MRNYKLIYVDDIIQIALTEFLRNCQELENFDYEEREFDPNESYEGLLNDGSVRSANIIIIDSKLFENGKRMNGKFTGEEFKLIINKIFPFIEVILISQNGDEKKLGVIQKFTLKGSTDDANDYYRKALLPKIQEAKKRIDVSRKIYSELATNSSIDKIIIEKIHNSMQGVDKFDNLSKEDIDNVINLFKKIEGK